MKRRTMLSVLVALLVGISAGWVARDFVALTAASIEAGLGVKT